MQEHTLFDSDSLEANEIHDIPFAEAELRPAEEEDDDEILISDSINLTDELLPMDADEDLTDGSMSIAFESLP